MGRKKIPLNKTAKSGRGMCPEMTAAKKKKRKKPNPYRAPLSVKRYYKGIHYGVDLLRDDLLGLIDDEDLKALIKDRAKNVKVSSSLKLTALEKQKTKEKLKEWEDKEWESI